MRTTRSALKFVAISLAVAVLINVATLLTAPNVRGFKSHELERWLSASPQAVMAQEIDAQGIDRADQSQLLYQRLPNLPLENHYVSIATGQPSPTNTLARRLIDYHLYIKSRSPAYRLDWKLTLADYLGANQWMNPATYPGADSLRPSPLPGDVAAIGQLNRVQRDELVAALVAVFQAGADVSGSSAAPQSATTSATPAPANSDNSAAPLGEARSETTAQPGAAQLLLP